jgi:hypothetical protein
VATVSQGTTLYRDYAKKGTYRYQVRAFNTAGASGYAGPVQVAITGR